MKMVRMFLRGKFARDDGNHLKRTIYQNNIILAYGVTVKNIEGISIEIFY